MGEKCYLLDELESLDFNRDYLSGARNPIEDLYSLVGELKKIDPQGKDAHQLANNITDKIK